MQTSMWHACHVERHFWKSRQDEMKVLFTYPTITWRTCNNARIYLTVLFFLALQRGYEYTQPTARVLIGTPSRFTWISLEPIDPPPPPPPPPPSPRMHAETTLRSNVVSDFKTIVKIELLTSSISFLQFLKKTKTYCYEWNELVNTRISRVRQASTSSIEATWTKSSKTCLWDERAMRLKKQAGKHISDSKLDGSEMSADAIVIVNRETKLTLNFTMETFPHF